jgi:alanine racemase
LTVARINLDHLRHNARVLQERLGETRLIAVVKADAYGHGALPVARVLQEDGVEHFGVATLPEAIELREGAIQGEILVLGSPLDEHLSVYARFGLSMVVATRATAEALKRMPAGERPPGVHVKVDTGMGRIGVFPEDAVEIVRLLEDSSVPIRGIWTHFATADEAQSEFSHRQIATFREVAAAIGTEAYPLHIASSAALLTLSEEVSELDAGFARLGLALYGVRPTSAMVAGSDGLDLRPVMQLASRITQVKTVEEGTSISYGCRYRTERRTRIATVAAGYADGYRRALTNRAEAGINGERYPVAGTVCMDMFMLDLGPEGDYGAPIAPGDEVVLFGEGGPHVAEVARWAKTISYEILCGIGRRVPRVYLPQRPS